LNFVKSQTNKSEIGKALDDTFKLISVNKIPAEQALPLLAEQLKTSYAHGAAYLPDGAVIVLAVGSIVVSAALLTAMVFFLGGYGIDKYGIYCNEFFPCDWF